MAGTAHRPFIRFSRGAVRRPVVAVEGRGMVLKGRNGNEVELALVKESLGDTQDAVGDSGWCTVVVRAATAGEEWEESAPCMNLYELQNLVEWLEAVGHGGGPETSEVELLSPELKFSVSQVRKDGVGIRVKFHIEDRPEEFAVDAPTEEDYVDVFLGRAGVRTAAASLRAALSEIEGVPKDDLSGERDARGEAEETLGLLGEGGEEEGGEEEEEGPS